MTALAALSFSALAVEMEARGVVRLRLNRPGRKNALSAAMMDELTAFAGAVAKTQAVRAVVLSGAGGVFCAGGDLQWMRAQIEADQAQRMKEARRLATMLRAMNEIEAPLIGRIEGLALGGGVGLAAICDTALAAEEARFGLTEVRLGLIPATIAPYVVARIGEGAARRAFTSARIFGAAEARTLGLITETAPAAALDTALEAEIAPYLDLPRGAVLRAKRLARALGPPIDDAVIEDAIRRLAEAWESEEAREGVAAFLEKRAPNWP